MTNQPDSSGSPRPLRARNRRVGWNIRITPTGILLLTLINLVILGGLSYGISRLLQSRGFTAGLNQAAQTNTPGVVTTTSNPSPTLTSTLQPSESTTSPPSETPTRQPATVSPQLISTLTLNQGLIILALNEGGNTHLFAYQPEGSGAGQPLPLTRLTYGPWDDINPAISPDGQTVAFSSNRTGYWDIYLLNLASGGIGRLTDTPTYEAAPSWSPDSKWLVYEVYLDDNLEIEIQSLDTLTDTIRLTDNPAADFSPVWSPKGRQIAFVSNRSGENEIWLADLDKSEEQRFQDISQDPNSKESHPAWSPDGDLLSWVGEQDGLRNLFLEDLSSVVNYNTIENTPKPQDLGSGDWPVWSADGKMVLTILLAPNRTYLTAYSVHSLGLALPPIELPGPVNGLSWGNISLGTSLQNIYEQAYIVTPTALYENVMASQPTDAEERYRLSALNNVEAPNPYLHDAVDESFDALRARIAFEAGWDFLSSLENAYVPLTTPLEPGMGNDWLYTGRAFAVNTLPINAGWMVVIRQDFGIETYWHIFLRALYQDGSAGIPLHDQPWDFDSRYNGNTVIYEQGGIQQATIPPGYWIDFTVRALSYGWGRLPALINWRASYPAARFNEFVSTGGKDWTSAMLELYPPEAMITPSPVIPPTRTPTATLRWYVSPTPTNTPTPRPTYTPYIIEPYHPMPSTSPTPGG
jgi:TolB protein